MLSINSADSMAKSNAILLVSPLSTDHDSLQSIFRGSPWKLQGTWTASDRLKTIRRHHGELPVVICQHSLPDGDWKHLLTQMDKMAVQPSLIVCSRLADERLWAEVLNHGAFDLLLGAPFEPEEVLRVTASAWSAWNRTARPGGLSRLGLEPALRLADSGAMALGQI